MSTDPAATNTPGTPGTPPPGDPGQPNWASYTRVAGIAAVAGLALFVALGFINLSAATGDEATKAAKTRFASAYLTGFTFWASLPIGALALLLIHHLVKTSWGLLLRQFFEAAARTMPLLFVMWLGLGLLATTKDASPYWWTHPEDTPIPEATELATTDMPKPAQAMLVSQVMVRKAVEHERKERAEGNYDFLSVQAFFVVGIVLFAIWGTMIYFLNKWGKEAMAATDRAGVEAALTKANKLGGPGLIIYGITITAAASQWVMSIEPSWASTMFPVIFAVNQFLTCFAFCVAALPLDGEPAAVQGCVAAEVPARHGHALVGVHHVLVVYLVLPVHAGVDREPAGRNPVLPQALRWRVVLGVGGAVHIPLRGAVLALVVPRHQDAPHPASLRRGVPARHLRH